MLSAFTPAIGLVPSSSLFGVIQQLGLTSGLQTCLDASVSASYSGSGQIWNDLSGNSANFFRGTTSGSAGDDPTFNGTAGDQTKNEYWSFNGSQMFTFTTSNPTWVNNIHKANQAITFVGWVNVGATGAQIDLAGTNGSSSLNIGFNINLRTTNVLRFAITNGSGGSGGASSVDSTSTVGTGWHFLSVSAVNTNAQNCFFQIDGNSNTVSNSLTITPSASSATYTMQLADLGNSAVPIPSGNLIANMAFWNIQLTSAQLYSIYMSTVGKFT